MKQVLSRFFLCSKSQQHYSVNDKNTNIKSRECGWTPLLLLVCYATTIGLAVPVGYFLGVMNTLIEFIKTWSREAILLHYNTELDDGHIQILWVSMVSIFLVGGIFGSLVGAWCCNRFGRKGCVLISAFLMTFSGLLLYLCRMANSVEMLLLGRLLAGVASALIYTAHPMYLLEIAPVELRGTVGVFCAVGVTVGICVAQVISLEQVLGTEENWQYALSFYTLLVVLCFAPCYWFPESPRWLFLIKGNKTMAAAELERLRGSHNMERVHNELRDMEVAAKAEEVANVIAVIENNNVNVEKKITKNEGSKSVLRDPQYFLPLFIVCSFQFCQQLSGINAIFYYSVPIFTKAGFTATNAAWMNLGAGFLNALISSMGPILMAKFNRRPMMMFSCIMAACSLTAMSFALNYIDLAEWLPIACIVFMTSFIFFFQFGLGPIPYFIGSELFEVQPRSVAMSIGSLCSWIGNLIIGMCFPLLQSIWGAFSFLPCAVVCIYGLLLTWGYLPESRGRDPADLKPLMSKGFRSKVKG